MAVKNRVQLESDYNNASGGSFPNNTIQAIKSTNLRGQSKDLIDSLFNITDDKYVGAAGLKPGINTIASLKGIVTTALAAGACLLFRDTGNGNVLRVYELVTGTDAESSPDVIRPNDYAASTNEKVWKLSVVQASTNTLTDYDASPNTFPAGALRGAEYQVTVAGTLSGEYVPVGSILKARQNSPSSDWTITGWKLI